MKKLYISPKIEYSGKLENPTLLSGSTILHDANTQKDIPGPEIGGDEEFSGGEELEG